MGLENGGLGFRCRNPLADATLDGFVLSLGLRGADSCCKPKSARVFSALSW